MFTIPRAMWSRWCCAVRFVLKRWKVQRRGQQALWTTWTCDRCGRNYRRDPDGTWRDWNPWTAKKEQIHATN